MVDWSELPLDVTALIAEKVGFYEDFIRLGLVCTSWRGAMTFVNQSTLSRRTPWMMVVEHGDSRNIQNLRFYRLYKERIVHEVVNSPKLPWYNNSTTSAYCLSTQGWLVHITENFEVIALVHPLSLDIIQCPSLPEGFVQGLPDRVNNNIFNSVVFSLSENPSKASSYTLAMISRPFNRVAVWFSHETKWVVRQYPEHINIMDINFYRGELYFVDRRGKVVPFSTGKAVNSKGLWSFGAQQRGSMFLVESSGVLLIVHQTIKVIISQNIVDATSRLFQAWEVNTENGETKEVVNLGNRALFLGFNSSFSVEACPLEGIKPNCIYYIGYYSVSRDLVVYELDSPNKVEDHYHPSLQILNHLPPPLWV